MNQEIIQALNIITNALLLLLLVFYFFYLRIKEKALNRKENRVDEDYHKIINETLARERKIIDDTTEEANQILSGAEYISESAKDSINQALATMINDLEEGALKNSRDFIQYYLNSLRQITQNSLTSLQNATAQMETSLEDQFKQFQATLLPNLEKEAERYKESRMRQIESSIQKIVQKVSQEVLNKSISAEDHERLVIEALDKAKTGGLFD